MRVFLTGATGFIGTHLLDEFLKNGHFILAHSRRESQAAPKLVHPNLDWITIPIDALKAHHLADIDVIVHLAATGVSPRQASWEELERVNVLGTLRLCQLAKETGAQIVISGTFAEYGLSGNRYEFIPVDAPLEPTFPYAVSKAAASQLALGYARAEGLRLSYLRIFNAFGDGQNDLNLWPSLKKSALSGDDFVMTSGEQIRDFIDVGIVAKCFLNACIRYSPSQGNPIVKNIGSGHPISIADFCSHWWREFQAKGNLMIGSLPYRPNEVMRLVPEIDSGFILGR